jgi:hypothetical protein
MEPKINREGSGIIRVNGGKCVLPQINVVGLVTYAHDDWDWGTAASNNDIMRQARDLGILLGEI